MQRKFGFIGAIVLCIPLVQGCAVAGAAVGVTKAAVKTAGSVTTGVVKGSVKAGGAVAAVLVGSPDEPEAKAVALSAQCSIRCSGQNYALECPANYSARCDCANTPPASCVAVAVQPSPTPKPTPSRVDRLAGQ